MSSPSSVAATAGAADAGAEAFTFVSTFAGTGGTSCGYRMAGGRGLLAVGGHVRDTVIVPSRGVVAA